MTVIPFRVRMRAKSRLCDGWSDVMVPAGGLFVCSPRRAADLLEMNAAQLVTFDADDVAAVASFTADSLRTMFELAFELGIRPD